MRRSLILTATVLCACGQQDASNGMGAPSPGAGQQANAARSDAAAALVPDFPSSTPIEVPNLGAPGTDSRSGNATARETDASPDEVAQFYREHFQRAGIPVRADTATATGGLISVARDGERGAMLTISRIGDKTRIAVIRGQ